MKRDFFRILILVVAFILPAVAAGASQIEEALRSSAGMQADFVHKFTPHGFKVEQVERGRVAFGAAPKMRWEYTRPEAKTFVFDGATSWLYFPAEKQVTVTRLGEKEKREIPFVTLSDPAQLNKMFTVRERNRGSQVVSEIRPRQKAAIREITATVDRPSRQIRSLAYTDSQGNRTVFEFSNYRKAPQSELVFRFTPAPGVDVIQSQ